MLPVDRRQLENVKGELLKLTKKEAAYCQLWHNMARTEELKKQNKEIADCQKRHNVGRREESKKQTNKEIADCQPCYNMQRRLNVIEGQNHHQIQTFYAARTVLYPIVEEHNCGEMDKLCLKCGGMYFRVEKNTRRIYTHC
ncbi:hypothetical protein AVEN_265771-1 [Araneus ventricosus]|uniref:Uncharacterized protein n=1 Tax=Araneus ventricosus TaxID=182803 RepID=A0A4Y2SCF1_ARAVE|nr:hypothetical protein AVEN_265771-1 [Araneus ventricosus]